MIYNDSSLMHAGIFSFSRDTKFENIVLISELLAKHNEYRSIWVRGVAKDKWGIEFLIKCNTMCKTTNLDDEIQYWLKKITQVVPERQICGIDIGGNVLVIKR